MLTLDRPIVLVGMMGAGKTSVGRRLAQTLGVEFRDADIEIEKAADCTVAEFFERYGEAEFRAGERKVIARLLADPPQIIATGGGAFMDADTRAEIKAHGVSVWLKAPLDLLLSRVSRKETRPLLKNGNPREVMARLLTEREPIYALADITVKSDDGPHEAVVKRVLSALENYKASETP